MFFGALLGLSHAAEELKRSVSLRADLVPTLLRCMATGLAISLLLGLLLHIFSSRRLSRYAASLELSVEGPFLRVREHGALLSDRKIHFRSIVDYATTQDSMMRRFGIYTLQMSMPGGGQNSRLNIPGVKDCLVVRDLLADIDRLREKE